MLRKWKASGVTDLRRFLVEHPALVREAMAATRAVDVNEKSVHLFRAKSREELLGPIDKYWPPQSDRVYRESVIAAIGGKPYYEADAAFCTADGQIFDALFTVAFPTGAVGRGNILVGIMDMTERNRARDALARVQTELAHAARVATLGELTASIAHEVNQPIGASRNNAYAALRFLAADAPDLAEVKEALECVVNETYLASNFIGRIRDQIQKLPPRMESLDLNATIEEVVALVRGELARHGVALETELADGLPQAHGDRVQLQQVMLNLILNAIEAMASTEDEARELAICTVQRTPRELLVAVRDSGPGVAPDDRERIFESFYTTKASGVGIGLAICRSIIDTHSGRLWVGANQPRGAVFSFTLPVHH